MFEKVKRIIAETLSIDEKLITQQSTLRNFGADSLDEVDIIMKIEDEFNIGISDEDAEKFKTIEDIINYLNVKKMHIHS